MGLFQVPWDTWSQFKCKLNPPISKTIYRYCLWLEFGLRWISIPTELPLTLLAALSGFDITMGRRCGDDEQPTEAQPINVLLCHKDSKFAFQEFLANHSTHNSHP